jgi:riboflavin biosynthesis pyrimidine reductase
VTSTSVRRARRGAGVSCWVSWWRRGGANLAVVRVLLPSPVGPAQVVTDESVPSPTAPIDALCDIYDERREPHGDRPWLLANMVAGLDGALTHDGRVGSLSSPPDRQLFVHLRGLADVVIVGAGTARAERYGPVRLPAEVTAARVDAGLAPHPVLVVVSRSLDLDPTARLFQGDFPTVVMTSSGSPPRRRDALRGVADVIEVGADAVDLAAGLRVLRDRGAAVALTEGGPTLLAELVDLDLLTMAVPTLLSRPLTRWVLASVAEDDGELYLRYTRGQRP